MLTITPEIMRINTFAAVRRGAALLDARDPNWAEGLNPNIGEEGFFKKFYNPEFFTIKEGENYQRYTVPTSKEGQDAILLGALFGLSEPFEFEALKTPTTPILDGFYYGFAPRIETSGFGSPANTVTEEELEGSTGYCSKKTGEFILEAWAAEITARQNQSTKQEAA